MIRPTTPADTPILIEIARGTAVFRPMELDALKEVLDDFHAYNHEHGHQAITYEQNGRPIGFAYVAPAAMTDRTWYLYWIAVSKQIQARGVGTRVLAYAEDAIRRANGRLLMLETSSLPSYDLTRKFYLKHGYEQAGVLKDYYTDGDDMVVFSKRITPKSPPG
jgi:ribosomal protein S18 acetylase RimI-like enzyme